ncbi:hypothetical protein F1734_17475 [Rhodococcus ruber]|uniref:zinc finger domain-containing protein n=1 Tax=Rhodococcus ruber TaxID=1830 RepID=UPI0019348E22|nr:hypothetical protein [Rhodococcus ruber]QRE81857.1 hypothetical protein F1734_17475 [Rhodococcus ruber]
MTLTRDDVIDVLTACASIDQRKVGATDITAWWTTLRPDLDLQLALDAVRVHYATSTDRALPGHINQLAVQIRKDRAEREDHEQREARQLANDQRHGIEVAQAGLAINAEGPPVPGAYQINDAVNRDCPKCKAEPYEPCTNPINGQPRRIPCPARLKETA